MSGAVGGSDPGDPRGGGPDTAALLREIADLGGGAPSLPPPPVPYEPDRRDESGSAGVAREPSPERQDADGGTDAERTRRATGRRQARLARQRRQRRIRRLILIVAGCLVAVAALVVVTWLVGREVRQALSPPASPEAGLSSEQDTILLVRQPERGGPATGATLLAAGPGESSGAVVFVPVGTLMDLPGFGLDQLALAHQYGGPGLVASTIENALGIRIDHVASVTDAGLAAFLDRSGGFEVDVRSQLVERAEDGTGTVVFQPGPQHMDGAQLAQLWSFRARDEDELSTFPRQQQILRRLLEEASDPRVIEAIAGDGAPMLSTGAEPAWVQQFFARMAAAAEAEDLSFSMLPVELFGGAGPDGSASYRMDEQETQRLVNRLLADSVPEGAGSGPRRVQVLNGVGTPAAGQVVDAKLQGSGFRIILNDNADSFDYATTLIIIYSEDEAAREAAERVQQLLGVGTIQVSRQPQSVVDLTIVVGSDLVAATGESVEPLGPLDPTARGTETEPE